MSRLYILTTTDPRDLAREDDFDGELTDCSAYTSIAAAARAQRDGAKRTNMKTYLLRVEVVREVDGDL